MTVEPGRQLAGRYRVEDLLSDRAGARSWRAVDEVLRRSVAVDVLPSDASRASALVQAARRSAVVTDGRFLRVLDASEENGDVYVVREWARGETLDLVLADGPVTHRRAAWIVREVAEAVSVAHGAGIYHLRLTPENVLVTDTGGVKIVGLATDAALHGINHADAEAEDVRGLGRLLYAALVARWPEGPESGLPAAPVEHGRLLRPGQVRAGVPRPVDEVCDRILGEPPRHQAEPLRHASAVAAELSGAVRLATDAAPAYDPDATQAAGMPTTDTGHQATSRVPPVGFPPPPAPAPSAWPDNSRPDNTPSQGTPSQGTQPQGTQPQGTRGAAALDSPPAGPPPPSTSTQQIPRTPAAPPAAGPPPRRDKPRARGWMWALLTLVVVALAVVAFLLGRSQSGDPVSQAADPQAPAQNAPANDPLRPVGIASVSAWDPFGEDGENDDEAALVLDGDPSTEWTTLYYEGNPDFGGLKPGLGLILDLGKPTDVSQVTIGVGGAGTDLEVRAAPTQTSQPPSQLGGYTTVGSVDHASGETVVELDDGVSTRYLLVWLTELPPDSPSTYRGRINEIAAAG